MLEELLLLRYDEQLDEIHDDDEEELEQDSLYELEEEFEEDEECEKLLLEL